MLADANVWSDKEKFQAISKEKISLEDLINSCNEVSQNLEDVKEFVSLLKEDPDEDMYTETLNLLDKVDQKLKSLEFKRMFSNPLDINDCYMDIQSGSGGTEAMDWANMILRMYLKFADKQGFKTEVIEMSEGEVAGIKSATIKISGEYAYGWFRTETGIHRLVRKSPFDSNNRRHTSFCSAFVYPVVDDKIEIEIKPQDIRVDTYRSSGAGGQQ